MKNQLQGLVLLAVMVFFMSNCQNSSLSNDDFAKDLQHQLIEAQDGDVIEIPEGTFEFNRPLSFNDVPNVTIKGAGKGKTILSFKNQVEGGEGLIVKSANGITLEGFTVADSKGDAIKVQGCTDVVLRDLETTWTGGKLATNGAYGLYPVTCTNILMENCEASYAMDAGIYLGQSTNAIIRNNYAHNNVAGIEIENTIGADVYGNKAVNNSGGLLIFDMPDLPQANGAAIKVHDNIVENNNSENFSSPGIVVNILPPGTGMLVMAHKDVDIYNNKISGHNTVSFALNSWMFTGRPFKSPEYDAFCHDIYIYDNDVTMGTGVADTTTDFGKLFAALGQGKPLGIAIDGILNPEHLTAEGSLKPEHKICFNNNGDLPFTVLDAPSAMTETGFDMGKLIASQSADGSFFTCEPVQ